MLSKNIKEYTKNLDFSKMLKKPLHLILIVLMVLFIILPVSIPIKLAQLIDSFVGSLVVLIIIVLLFLFTNPIIGLLGLIVGYILIYRSSVSTGTNILDKYDIKGKQMYVDSVVREEQKNAPSGELEIEAVKEIPPHEINTELLDAPYKGLLASDDDHAPAADTF